MLNGNQRNAQRKGNAQQNETTMINIPHNKTTEELNHHSRKQAQGRKDAMASNRSM